jgi:hypothetical protein
LSATPKAKRQSDPSDDQPLFTRGAPAFRADSIDEAARTFDSILTTENAASIYDYASGRVIDEVLVAEGMEFQSYLPLLRNHKRFSELDVLGYWDDPRREAAAWVSRAHVSSADDIANTWRRIVDRAIRGVSIGYWPREYVDIAPGKRERVNGREYEAGARLLRITTRSLTFEASIVPIGADSDALIRSLNAPPEEADPAPPRRRMRYLTTPSPAGAPARRRHRNV